MTTKQYKCERCNSNFTRKQALIVHLNTEKRCKPINSDISIEDLLKKIKEPGILKKQKRLANQSDKERITILEAQVKALQGNRRHILAQNATKPYKSILDAECAKSYFTGCGDFGGGINGCIEIFKYIFNTNVSTSCWAYDRTLNLLEVKCETKTGRVKIVKRDKKQLREFLVEKIHKKKTAPQHWDDWFHEDADTKKLENRYYDDMIWDKITKHIEDGYELNNDYLL